MEWLLVDRVGVTGPVCELALTRFSYWVGHWDGAESEQTHTQSLRVVARIANCDRGFRDADKRRMFVEQDC